MERPFPVVVMNIHQHVDDSVVIMIYRVTFELTVIIVASETYTLSPRYLTFSFRAPRVHALYDTYTLVEIAKLEKPHRIKQQRQ